MSVCVSLRLRLPLPLCVRAVLSPAPSVTACSMSVV
uniref:Uncharacterized protein n=1 Tax=Anguilla anguilla TaxID=7936 RepID=A0A0E9UFX6_ANGAN